MYASVSVAQHSRHFIILCIYPFIYIAYVHIPSIATKHLTQPQGVPIKRRATLWWTNSPMVSNQRVQWIIGLFYTFIVSYMLHARSVVCVVDKCSDPISLCCLCTHTTIRTNIYDRTKQTYAFTAWRHVHALAHNLYIHSAAQPEIEWHFVRRTRGRSQYYILV